MQQEEYDMNIINQIKIMHRKGDKVRLIQMKNEPQMPNGLIGKVQKVDDIGQIHVQWKNGSSLALNLGEDDFVKL